MASGAPVIRGRKTFAKISTIEKVVDKDGNDAHPATDEAIYSLKNTLKPARPSTTQYSIGEIEGGHRFSIFLDEDDTDTYSAVVITVRASYSGSATDGVRVSWAYSGDGSNWDSDEDIVDCGNYEYLTFSPGETRIRTILIPIFQPYVWIRIDNRDSSNSVTNVAAWVTMYR